MRGWTLDLSDRAAIDRVFAEIAAHFGGIDILVNNAGISIPIAIDNENYEAAWQKSLDVLITAHTRTIRAALPHLRKSKARAHRQHRLHRRPRRDALRQPVHRRQTCGDRL